MAVVVSISQGHDASYPWKTIGSAEGCTFTGERGAGYYLSAWRRAAGRRASGSAMARLTLVSSTVTRCCGRISSRCMASS